MTTETLSCKTCCYYARDINEHTVCRKGPPEIEGFPSVYSTDWCGEHSTTRGVSQGQYLKEMMQMYKGHLEVANPVYTKLSSTENFA